MQPENPIALTVASRPYRGLASGPAIYARILRFITEGGETVDSRRHASVDHALHDHGGVGAAKPERIRERNIDLALARCLRHEIDRRLDRRVIEIDGRRSNIITNRK